MASRAWIAVIIACIGLSTGCTLCPPGPIDNYGARGSKWQRGNLTSGRVGSSLSDAGEVQVGGQLLGSESMDGLGESIQEVESDGAEIIEDGRDELKAIEDSTTSLIDRQHGAIDLRF